MRAFEFLTESRQPKIGYHVTSTHNLSKIIQDGIKPDSRGNTYVWDTLEMAEWFRDFQNDHDQDRTILTLDLSGLPMTLDDEATDMSEWSSRFRPGTPGGAWIIRGNISAGRIIKTINEGLIKENAPRTLYHGTLKSNLPNIKKQGLEPKIGEFTRHFYDDDPDLEELVFASSKKDINKGLNAIIFQLKRNNIKPTPENIIRHGALVVVKDEYNEFEHRPVDDYNDWNEYPRQVERGDFYSREPVQVTYILQNNKLKDLLRREGFDAWMGTKHPKLMKKDEMTEAKYDYPLKGRTNPSC